MGCQAVKSNMLDAGSDLEIRLDSRKGISELLCQYGKESIYFTYLTK